ncbi:hypothetical protein EXT46_03965 [Pseudoalteromonas sp. CO325X]|uniref:hypothetical protein n=1 Tax=Pseudoalteromonas sp. CO325X TaxID=1777262 RepID=UPI00102304CD|nr:hypothetical protein [Pseudoalteromonas sp. CO325X]RZF84476.1 hypothetical protein EXT46_03965 [Pseudoalteromonas sp. CO325X]
MALFSILLGVGAFAISMAIAFIVGISLQSQDINVPFGFMLALFPALLGMILVIPSTIFRSVFVLKKQSRQAAKERAILGAGILVSLFYCVSIYKVVMS